MWRQSTNHSLLIFHSLAGLLSVGRASFVGDGCEAITGGQENCDLVGHYAGRNVNLILSFRGNHLQGSIILEP